VIFSIGAIVGAMITMFAAVAQRVGEIGTLRALGFRRGAVLVAFLAERCCCRWSAACVGLAAASGMQAVDISTTNFQTFSRTRLPLRTDADHRLANAAVRAIDGLGRRLHPGLARGAAEIVDCLRAA
jgi:putative ABC transport system permease protein